jgi:hypothetical protein
VKWKWNIHKNWINKFVDMLLYFYLSNDLVKYFSFSFHLSSFSVFIFPFCLFIYRLSVLCLRFSFVCILAHLFVHLVHLLSMSFSILNLIWIYLILPSLFSLSDLKDFRVTTPQVWIVYNSLLCFVRQRDVWEITSPQTEITP